MEQIWKIFVTALIVTVFIFMEILACVLFDMNFLPILILIPAFLMCVPVLLLRCCGSSSDFGLSDTPRCLHWAEFTAAFFATGLVAIPIILTTTDSIEVGAMCLSLGGVLFVAGALAGFRFFLSRSDDGMANITGF